MRPPTLISNLSNVLNRVSVSTDISLAAYATHTCAAQNCDGGPCVVLPVATGQPYTGQFTATSMCSGSSALAEWWWNDRIIQVSSPTSITHASWLYVTENNQILYAMENSAATAPMLVNGILFTPPKPRARETSAKIRAGRKALRRSIDIYTRFRGPEEVRRFLRGETVVYEGEQYNYRVKKTVKVLQHTMNPDWTLHPYTFFAADKKTDKELSRGCISISGLPVLDQLLALSFYIQDPKDEQDLIKTVNWTPGLPRKPRARPVMQEAA